MTKEVYQCIGCGVAIQTEDPKQPGYLPASALEKGIEKGEFYCQRCFKLRHYNELQDLEMDADVFLDRLSAIAQEDAFIIHLIDLFDVEGSVIPGLHRFVAQQPFIVVGNKLDLLPKSVKENRVRHWLEVQLHQMGLKPKETILIAATQKGTLHELITLIEREVKHRDIYIVGAANVGKSTLINQLIAHFGGEKNIITTSNVPGTTLDLIEIPLTHEHAIYDTPGIFRESQLTHYLGRESQAVVIPKKEVKARTFQLNPGQTIFLAGLGRVDFIQGEKKTGFTFYVSNELYLHRTKTEGATAFYEKHVGELLAPPTEEEQEALGPWMSRELNLPAHHDCAISGLGWLTVNEDVGIRLHLPASIHYSIRPSII